MQVKHLNLLVVLIVLFYNVNGKEQLRDVRNYKPLNVAAAEAYIFAYPAVLTNVTIDTQKSNASVNQFEHWTRLPTPADKLVVKMNMDTLYSNAYIDVMLNTGPIVLSFPPMDRQDRYYLFQFMDHWTNTIAAPSSRTVGQKGGQFVILGPGQEHVKVPSGMQKIITPTRNVVLIGRTQCFGKDDIPNIIKLQQQYSLKPLFPPPLTITKIFDQNLINSNANVMTSVTPPQIVKNMTAEKFFGLFTEIMAFNNMPSPPDLEINETLQGIGIVPGVVQNWTNLTEEQQILQEVGVELGKVEILAYDLELSLNKVNHWQMEPKNMGNYSKDYSTRVAIADVALFANPREDAVYYTAKEDTDGGDLMGSQNYTITFETEPPVNAFWSITLYDIDGWFVPNNYSKYSVSSWQNLTKNSDGSIEIFIQTEKPATPEKEKNWIPSPSWVKEKYQLFFRAYWPQEAILNRTWVISPIIRNVTKTDKTTSYSFLEYI